MRARSAGSVPLFHSRFARAGNAPRAPRRAALVGALGGRPTAAMSTRRWGSPNAAAPTVRAADACSRANRVHPTGGAARGVSCWEMRPRRAGRRAWRCVAQARGAVLQPTTLRVPAWRNGVRRARRTHAAGARVISYGLQAGRERAIAQHAPNAERPPLRGRQPDRACAARRVPWCDRDGVCGREKAWARGRVTAPPRGCVPLRPRAACRKLGFVRPRES